jgi:hypothetical protein
MKSQGYAHDSTPVFQDNQGVLAVMDTGRTSRQRTKHLDIRHFFAKDCADRGEIALMYVPTADMLADVMTKPMNGMQLRRLVANVLGTADT